MLVVIIVAEVINIDLLSVISFMTDARVLFQLRLFTDCQGCLVKSVAIQRSHFFLIGIFILFIFFVLIITYLHVDPILGPKLGLWCILSICHWNLNSLTTYDFSTINLLEIYTLITVLLSSSVSPRL